MNKNKNNEISCPICSTKNLELTHRSEIKDFYRCLCCRAIFVPRDYHLNPRQEKEIYDLHNNDPNDQNYRNFLSKLAIPILERIAPKSHGLDFGCGPGPTLSLILEEHGHRVDLYDPFYFDNKPVLKKQFDFITMTEVAEHLNDPIPIFQNIVQMIKLGGFLGIMTQFIPKNIAFKNWGYKNDPTHIVFYQKETFEWLEAKLELEIIYLENNCVILKKPFKAISRY